MKNLIFRVTFIIIAGLALLSFVFPWSNYGMEVPFSGQDYKLGLDLQGGVELDYKVDLEEAKLEEDYTPQKENQILEGLKSIIDKRIEALKINDSVITTASYAGEQHIIVQIPLKGKNPEEDKINITRAKEAIGKVMKIEFKELRNGFSEQDTASREALAQKALKEALESKYNFFVTASKYKDNFANTEIGSLDIDLETLKSYFSLENETPENGIQKEIIKGNGIGILAGQEGSWIVNIKDFYDKPIAGKPGETEKTVSFDYIFITKNPSEWKPAEDSKGRILNDKYFVQSSVQYNEAFQPMVELTFNNDGAEIFGELSTRLVNQQMGIFVGGELLTAPNINEPILSGRAVITGNYTPEEANILAQDINTGVVPAPIYLTSEKAIDSKLGADSLQKLIIAGLTGFVLIFVFLIFVYRLSGFLASVALLLYVVIILTAVKFIGITLTLASIAGLILSIGMAIDANILIFERIRDELNNGLKMSKATRIGFKKSWTAIWDSNVTGLIVAIILFVFGINLIKGFGLMLAIGILVSLFSVMWISRVLIFLASDSCKKEMSFIGKKG